MDVLSMPMGLLDEMNKIIVAEVRQARRNAARQQATGRRRR